MYMYPLVKRLAWINAILILNEFTSDIFTPLIENRNYHLKHSTSIILLSIN